MVRCESTDAGVAGHSPSATLICWSALSWTNRGGWLWLEFVPSVSYEHPIVGRIASFGSLHGSIDGVQIRVEVRSDETNEGPTHFWTELRAERIGEAPHSAPRVIVPDERAYRIQRDGPTLFMRPSVREAGSSQAYLYRVVTDASALGRLVTELVALARSKALP